MRIVFLAALFLLFGNYVCAEKSDNHESYEAISKGSTLFDDMLFTDADGVSYTLKEWSKTHGHKPILVIIWASWCSPCLRELPTVNALKNSALGKKIEILPIAIEAPVSGHAYSLDGITMPLFYSETIAAFMAMEGIQGIPATFLYTPEGHLVLRESGGRNWNSERNHLRIEKALAMRKKSTHHSKKPHKPKHRKQK